MENVMVGSFFTAMASFVLWVALAIVYRKRSAQVDELTHDGRFGWNTALLPLWRMTANAYACMFDFCARRTHPTIDFAKVAPAVKRPLRLIAAVHLVFLASFVVSCISFALL